MTTTPYVIHPVGRVESPLAYGDVAPRQGDEGAPDAWLVLDPPIRPALLGLEVDTDVIVLSWLDRARRDVLVVHPRGEQDRPVQGVFSTRSPDRPNPIGLHRVHILAIEDTRIHVRNLEVFDGTPIVDIKPVLEPIGER
jgi:tRNA-Thr(GGU) m(6)t(6)A37 methyltransferase TsaA